MRLHVEELPAFFQTGEFVLRVNKIKTTGENAFNGDHFGIEGSHVSSNDKKAVFWIFL